MNQDTCVTDSCGRPRMHREWCGRHYQQWWRSGAPPLPNPYEGDGQQKRCRACEQDKPLSDFGPRSAGKGGLQSRCRACTNERKSARRAEDPDARRRERDYEQRPDVRERNKRKRYERVYGVAPERYDAMLAEQNGKCAVCGTTPHSGLCVDHDHVTGVVRGLLCYPCNVALGLVNDNTDRLQELISYVETHRTE